MRLRHSGRGPPGIVSKQLDRPCQPCRDQKTEYKHHKTYQEAVAYDLDLCIVDEPLDEPDRLADSDYSEGLPVAGQRGGDI